MPFLDFTEILNPVLEFFWLYISKQTVKGAITRLYIAVEPINGSSKSTQFLRAYQLKRRNLLWEAKFRNCSLTRPK